MRDRGLSKFPFVWPMGIAVECENTSGFERSLRHLVVDILAARVAVDLHRYGRARCGCEDAIPVRRHTRPNSVLSTAWVSKDMHAGGGDRGQDAPRLVGRGAQR